MGILPFIQSFYHRGERLSSINLVKNDNCSKRIISTTQSVRKAVMIHMAMVKDVMYGKTMRKSYA